MNRSVYSGNIAIGLFRVPVVGYKARDNFKSPFNRVTTCCGGAVKKPDMCASCGKVVKKEATRRALNVGTSREPSYVVFEENELGKLERSNLEVTAIAPASLIPSMRLVEPLFVAPEKKADHLKLYSLLHSQMRERQLALYGFAVFHSQKCPIVISATEGGMVLWKVAWGEDERQQPSLPNCVLLPAEMDAMGKAFDHLVKQLGDYSAWSGAQDDYRVRLNELVGKKQAGVPLAEDIAPQPVGSVIDMLNAITGGN